MKVSFKLALDLSKSQVKAIKRQGVIDGLDMDDPPGRLLMKRVLEKLVNNSLSAIFASAPFPVTADPEGEYEETEAVGCTGPPGSAPVEDDPAPITTHKRPRRSRTDSTQRKAS